MAHFRRSGSKSEASGNHYQQNVGVSGVVYILENPGLAAGIIKIGCSRRSGYARAQDLNRDASTGTPGTFRCVFECKTTDCGTAERLVFQRLTHARRGKWGQEYFEVELQHAKNMITQVCSEVDVAQRNQAQRSTTSRTTQEVAQINSPPSNINDVKPVGQTSRVGSYSPFTYFTLKKWLWGLAFAFVLGNWLLTGKPAKAPAPRLQSTGTTPVRQITPPPKLAASPIKSSPAVTVKVEEEVTSDLKPADLPTAPSHLTTDLQTTGGQSMQRDLASLNQDERQSIDAVCMRAKFREGPAALKECQEKQLRSLSDGVQAPDLSGLSHDERQSIDAVCMRAKYKDGPAALHECQEKQLLSLRYGTAAPDLSGLSRNERQSIDAVCMHDKYQKGPAAFNRCLNNQFVALVAGPREPDLSGLTREELQSIESVCLTAKYRQGPKAHNQCLVNQLEKLHR